MPSNDGSIELTREKVKHSILLATFTGMTLLAKLYLLEAFIAALAYAFGDKILTTETYEMMAFTPLLMEVVYVMSAVLFMFFKEGLAAAESVFILLPPFMMALLMPDTDANGQFIGVNMAERGTLGLISLIAAFINYPIAMKTLTMLENYLKNANLSDLEMGAAIQLSGEQSSKPSCMANILSCVGLNKVSKKPKIEDVTDKLASLGDMRVEFPQNEERQRLLMSGKPSK